MPTPSSSSGCATSTARTCWSRSWHRPAHTRGPRQRQGPASAPPSGAAERLRQLPTDRGRPELPAGEPAAVADEGPHRRSVRHVRDTPAVRQGVRGESNWISISPRVRRYLADELPRGSLGFPIVSWAGPSPRTRSARHGTARTPVVGRQSRDHVTKWLEDASALAKAYLAGTEYEVQLLGGTNAAEEVHGHRPKNWVVHPFDSLSVTDFLDGIDVFITSTTAIISRNSAARSPIAVGVPCVPPNMRRPSATPPSTPSPMTSSAPSASRGPRRTLRRLLPPRGGVRRRELRLRGGHAPHVEPAGVRLGRARVYV